MTKKQLILDKYGQFLSKHSERLQVKAQGKIVEEVPLIHLESVLITSRGVTISSDVVELCSERGIDIVFISGKGKVLGRLGSPMLVGTVKTRREQLFALSDKRGLTVGKAVAVGKIANQRNLIRYFAKYRKTAKTDVYKHMTNAAAKLLDLQKELELIDAENVDTVREKILNLEGRSASIYWDTMKNILGDEITWPGRKGRGATDPVNSSLNYGYGILYGQIERAITLAGLDPFAGFVHTDRSGKPSLVLDLIEEFRQIVVDRAIFSMISKGTKIEVNQEGLLEDAPRKTIAQKVFDRLDSDEKYEGMKHKLNTIMLRQAQTLASFLRNEKQYKPFVGGW